MENEIEINGTTYVRKDSVQQTPTNKDGLPYVICRGYYCGVHAGYLKTHDGNHAELVDSRRLWKWNAVKGISLSDVAKYGIIANDSKICTKLDEIWLGDVYEIIPCTDVARKTIEEAADADVN